MKKLFYKGKQPGFFHGDVLQDPTAIRNTITAALVQDFSTYDPETKITSVRVPTSLEEVANAMYKRHLIFKEASQVVEATDTDETIEEKVNEAEAEGNFDLAERLKAFQLRMAESEKSTSAATPEEARRALEASRVPASEFEAPEIPLVEGIKGVVQATTKVLNDIAKYRPDHPEYEKVMAELRKRAAAQEDN